MIEMIKKIFCWKKSEKELEIPFNVSQASLKTIFTLEDMGVLEFKEDGIHVVDI